MDPITALALSVHNPLLTLVGQFLDNDIFYTLLVLAMVLVAERKNDKRLKVIVLLGVAFALGFAVKSIVAEPRPCAGASWCPSDYAFPSDHTVVALALLLGFLNRKLPFFLVFALFVAFTRLNLGVHTFGDILGAVPVALAAYFIVEASWARFERRLTPLFQNKFFR
ncbi:MAG: phosphatase PAP2 family protein [Candidatus Anstonellaceae archaeon]